MILNSGEDEMNVAFKFRIDGFDYVIFASSDTMKCFECDKEGHTKRVCPGRAEGAGVGLLTNENAGSSNVEQISVDNVTMNARKEGGDVISAGLLMSERLSMRKVGMLFQEVWKV